MAHVIKRNGKWQATYRGPDNREHTRTFSKKVDAENWAADEKSKMLRGSWIDPRAGRVTVEAYAEGWLERRDDLAERTSDLYRSLLDNHIVPRLGAVPLAQLKPSAVDAWHSGIASKHPTTAAKAYRLLSNMMNAAVRDKLVASNPCQKPGASVEKAPERPVATIAEVSALADAMPERLRIAVLLAAWCQLRRGEILGLRRRDIDLLRGTVSVVLTRGITMTGKEVVKPPKTDAGCRTVAAPANVQKALKAHLSRFVAAEADAPLLVGEKGGPVIPLVLHTAWDKARREVKRPDLHFHDLRHSGLTWAAATGATTKELMRRAGHASPDAALRYQHATDDRDRVLADALATLAKGAPVVSIEAARRKKSG